MSNSNWVKVQDKREHAKEKKRFSAQRFVNFKNFILQYFYDFV